MVADHAAQWLRHLKRSVVGPPVRRLRDRIDDLEVRNGRRLVRALKSDAPPDVVAFGDSNWLFRAGYDTDQRNLPTMLAAELGTTSMHLCASAGYYPTLFRAYVRLIEQSDHRPVVIVPLCARLLSVAWSTHPRYTYAKAIEYLEGVEPGRPVRSIRASFPPPPAEDFARYGKTVIETWAGAMSIDDLRAPILDPEGHGLDETERRRYLYAYHHGERIDPGAHTVAEVERLGRALRALGAPVVAFETTVPVDEGVALWGEQFRENAEHSFALMRQAFRRGYGDEIDIIESGLICPRDEFIDPADGTEHLNQHGRMRIAALLADAVDAAIRREQPV